MTIKTDQDPDRRDIELKEAEKCGEGIRMGKSQEHANNSLQACK